jgi:hypothetical protein
MEGHLETGGRGVGPGFVKGKEGQLLRPLGPSHQPQVLFSGGSAVSL